MPPVGRPCSPALAPPNSPSPALPFPARSSLCPHAGGFGLKHGRPSQITSVIHRLRLPLLWLLTLGAAVVSLAKDISTYRLGDVVTESIVAPTALTVPDPDATIAMKTAVAMQTPAVFRSFPGITNTFAPQFHIAFVTARSNFTSSLEDTFHVTLLDHATVMSPDFGYLITAYNFDHPDLPVPYYLAMDWAYGKDGSVEESKWLGEMLAIMQSPIRPDTLPPGFNAGDTVTLIPVSRADETLGPTDLINRGRVMSQSQITSLTQAQMLFRRNFDDQNDPILARALAAWIQPNCLPDLDLTQATRDWTVKQMVAAEYYAPGQIIALKGAMIDKKILAAINEIIHKPANTPSLPAGETRTVLAPPVANKPAPATRAESSTSVLPQKSLEAGAPAFTPSQRLLAIAGAIGLVILIVFRQVTSRPRPVSSVPSLAGYPKSEETAQLQTELAPQIMQVVRQAFVYELAGQRRDLLTTQQAAAAEVVELVQRMDALQVAMQERLRTYETQIQQLEAELTARKEENRQLIRLKIQMIRQQVKLETSPQRIDLN